MKTRYSFVSNSSSTSFVIAYQEPNPNIQAAIHYIENPHGEGFHGDNDYEMGTDLHFSIGDRIEDSYELYTRAIAGDPDQAFVDRYSYNWRKPNNVVAEEAKEDIKKGWDELLQLKQLSSRGYSFIDIRVGYHDEYLQSLYAAIKNDPTTIELYCDH